MKIDTVRFLVYVTAVALAVNNMFWLLVKLACGFMIRHGMAHDWIITVWNISAWCLNLYVTTNHYLINIINYKWVLWGLFAYFSVKVVQWYRVKVVIQKSGFIKPHL